MTKFYATQEKMQEVLGAFPSPDRTSVRWSLYDYRTLNGYFGMKLTDSIWRGVIQSMTSHGTNFVAGVYFVGCSRDLTKEQFFLEVYKELINLSTMIGSLQDVLSKEKVVESPIRPEAVEGSTETPQGWIDKIRAWWFNG